jgi:tryptophan 2,3-dioxygenase
MSDAPNKGNPQGNPSALDMREPILPGTAASDYERYLRTEELLALQKTPEQMTHADELLFQVVHQASELLLKGAAWELERALAYMAEGELHHATRLILRANIAIEHPTELLHLLETITPYEYHIIRAGLGHGSGLDSPGFLGLLHIGPRLREAFQNALDRTGVSVQEMYRRWQDFFPLHELAEALLDFDTRVQIFRYAHLKLAERIIGGGVIGTMGTPVEILKKRQEHVFFKDLWDVRNQITAECNETQRMPGYGSGSVQK